jgi:hypothetical protein
LADLAMTGHMMVDPFLINVFVDELQHAGWGGDSDTG